MIDESILVHPQQLGRILVTPMSQTTERKGIKKIIVDLNLSNFEELHTVIGIYIPPPYYLSHTTRYDAWVG